MEKLSFSFGILRNFIRSNEFIKVRMIEWKQLCSVGFVMQEKVFDIGGVTKAMSHKLIEGLMVVFIPTPKCRGFLLGS